MADHSDSIKIFDEHLNSHIKDNLKIIKRDSITSLPLSDKYFIEEVATTIGPYYNRTALLQHLLKPTVTNLGIVPHLNTSLTGKPFTLRADIRPEDKEKAINTLKNATEFHIPVGRVKKVCQEIFPALTDNQTRLFTTLYYSYEFDRYINKFKDARGFNTSTHLLIVNEVLCLSERLSNHLDFQLFNEILENNITYGSYFSTYSTSNKRAEYQIILSDTFRALTLLSA